MSTRFEWMHLPDIQFVQEGYDVREEEVLPRGEWNDESTVTDAALLLWADECTVVTGSEEDLADWAVAALRKVVGHELYEKCAVCHLFIEPNEAFGDDPEHIARYMHLANDDYPEDEALDASHEPHPSGVALPLAVWKVYGPQHMRARFGRS